MERSFEQLPDLVWQKILDMLYRYNPRDIEAVFAAFPKLNDVKRLQERKVVWLSIDAFLILTTWKNLLGVNDLLICRSVCKGWSLAVDTMALVAEDNRSHPLPNPDKLRICYWNENNKYSSPWSFPHFGLYCFDSFASIDKFLKLMAKHVYYRRLYRGYSIATKNPFISGSVTFRFENPNSNPNINLRELWQIASRFFARFGQHIWHFEFIESTNVRDNFHPERYILELLRFLPNLQSLSIKSSTRSAFTHFYSPDEYHARLPFLPFLQKMKLSFALEGGEVERILLQKYSHGLKGMAVPLDGIQGNLYGNLEFLELDNENQIAVPGCTFQSENFIFDTDLARNIKRLFISADISFVCDDFEKLIIKGILQQLPSLTHLEIGDENDQFRERGFILECDTVHPLKFLKMWDNRNLVYNFLLRFPSLRHLALRRDAIFDQMPRIPTVYSHIKLRLKIDSGDLYSSNIWELLPELRRIAIVTLSLSGDESMRIYTRELYSYRTQIKEGPEEGSLEKAADTQINDMDGVESIWKLFEED